MLAASSPALQAADVTITVNGKVVAKPCTVSTTNASVELGELIPSVWYQQVPHRPGKAPLSI
jgi:type 1 fimbria pilin